MSKFLTTSLVCGASAALQEMVSADAARETSVIPSAVAVSLKMTDGQLEVLLQQRKNRKELEKLQAGIREDQANSPLLAEAKALRKKYNGATNPLAGTGKTISAAKNTVTSIADNAAKRFRVVRQKALDLKQYATTKKKVTGLEKELAATHDELRSIKGTVDAMHAIVDPKLLTDPGAAKVQAAGARRRNAERNYIKYFPWLEIGDGWYDSNEVNRSLRAHATKYLGQESTPLTWGDVKTLGYQDVIEGSDKRKPDQTQHYYFATSDMASGNHFIVGLRAAKEFFENETSLYRDVKNWQALDKSNKFDFAIDKKKAKLVIQPGRMVHGESGVLFEPSTNFQYSANSPRADQVTKVAFWRQLWSFVLANVSGGSDKHLVLIGGVKGQSSRAHQFKLVGRAEGQDDIESKALAMTDATAAAPADYPPK
jgi:hypothetical protein